MEEDVKTIGFNLYYKLMNLWSVVEGLSLVIIAIWLGVFFGPVVPSIMTLIWLAGRVVSWKQAQAIVHGLQIRLVQDEESNRWYLYED